MQKEQANANITKPIAPFGVYGENMAVNSYVAHKNGNLEHRGTICNGQAENMTAKVDLNDKYIAVGYFDGLLRVFDWDTGRHVQSINTNS
jgi:hypothetical protein